MSSNISIENINKSNVTSTPAPAPFDSLYFGLSITTQILIYYCMIVHVGFIILLIFVKSLRKKPLVYINHAAIASIFYPLGILIYLYFNPATIDPKLANIVCSIFEIYWPFSIYIRMFSILLIAVHRYLGVFRLELFKKVNNSNAILATPIVLTWIVAIVLSFIGKYAFSTTYTITYCLDGFSSIWLNCLLYALFYVILSMIVPAIAIIIIYSFINQKLKTLGSRILGENSSTRLNKKKEKRFANQFFLMCLVVILNICGIFMYSLRSLVPNYFQVFYYWRLVIRCWILIMASLIPIFSIYFNPSRRRLVSFIGDRSSTAHHTSTTGDKY